MQEIASSPSVALLYLQVLADQIGYDNDRWMTDRSDDGQGVGKGYQYRGYAHKSSR